MSKLSIADARGLLPPGPWTYTARGGLSGGLLDANGEMFCEVTSPLLGRALAMVPEMLAPPAAKRVHEPDELELPPPPPRKRRTTR